MSKEPCTHRISFGLTDKEWEALHGALKVEYTEYQDIYNIGPQQRNWFMRNAIWAICKAIARQGKMFHALACDVRQETQKEMHERLGKKTLSSASLDWKSSRWN
jgi:hypothetical protein